MLQRSALLALLSVLGLALAPACNPEFVPAPAREVVLELEGLDCEGCARNVHAALVKVSGVRSAEVDHTNLRARVTCAESTSAESLVQAVTSAGAFKARPLAP